MTHLGSFLHTVLNEEGIDAKALAERIGIDQAVLSRLITGTRRTCNRKTLHKLVAGVSARRIKQAHCLAAYLQDQCFPPHDKRVVVAVR